MSIEFSCAQCGQQLRVSEDAAGKRAKCPKCSHVNEIPEIPQPAAAPEDDDLDLKLMPEVPKTAPAASPFSPFPQAESNPYSSPRTGFGSPLGAKPTSPFGGAEITNVPTDIGCVLNYSFALWKEHLGILIGATVVVAAVGMVISYGMMAIVAVMQQANQPEAANIVNGLGSIAGQLIQLYLGIGVAQLMLKLARNQPAEFSDIFNGGSRFWPVLGVYILFLVAVILGFVLLIIPGIIILMMWWPCYYLVIDDKSPVLDSFGTARMITEGNFGTTFLIWLLGVGIMVIGFLACCVGMLAATPLIGMMYVVAYLMMSGQIPQQPEISFTK